MSRISLACAIALVLTVNVHAKIKKIVIDTKVSPAFNGASFGSAGQYETLAGRAFGELDPKDSHNSLITDIQLAPRNANGKVEYMSTFFLVKPIDMSKSSHLLWQEVPNRGGRLTIGVAERTAGDIGLSTGCHGDKLGATAKNLPNTNDYAVVPIAKNPDGSPITGTVIGRIFNARGMDSQRMIVYANQVPYQPASLDTGKATLIAHASETIDGVVSGTENIPAGEWAFASCSATNPFPGTPDATRVCLKNGFDPALSYYVLFTAKDPYVLGIGFAAFRDVASFFKNEKTDELGTANPVANGISWIIARGRSQSGNFLKAFIHQGFNQDETGRQVHDGSWPIIAAGQLALNVRFGTPDGVPRLYEPGREAPQWWSHQADPVRKREANGILDRCTATNSCPKIVETFGSAELWYLKMSTGLVGPSADTDIPLASNVRRYYLPSTAHGGGPGGFDVNPPAIPNGSGLNWGQCVLPANPVPYTGTSNAILAAFREWVMHGKAMPPSRYPKLSDHTLVAPTKEALGFPTLPGLPPSAPTGLFHPNFDYDYGPHFNQNDQTGIRGTELPTIKKALKGAVPKVDADGNELGGVPIVLRDAPLGTYLGWNLTAGGFNKGKLCSFTAGMIPFAKTKAERQASGDPRLSLEERYGDHAGYVAAVKAAAAKAVSQGFLLQRDADALIEQAAASNVLTTQ